MPLLRGEPAEKLRLYQLDEVLTEKDSDRFSVVISFVGFCAARNKIKRMQPQMSLTNLKRELRKYARKDKASLLQRYFKTGPGEYAEGDIFIGVQVPYIRKVAGRYQGLSIKDTLSLLKSAIHEERLLALLILVLKFAKADQLERKKIYLSYLAHTRYINNWDLVDLTAHHIVGAFLEDKSRKLLYSLARSRSLWERRIAILATFYFIRQREFSDALSIGRMLLRDKEDLIHKASGWMLREVGKRDKSKLVYFLDKYRLKMPRTMLRYAIERFPEPERKKYLG